MPGRPPIYTIPPHLPFLDALVAGLKQHAGGDPLALARCTVLLPTRRACRSLREAFLRASDGAQLLPRLRPVGDVDDEEIDEGTEDSLDVPPAIPETRRRLLLTRLVLRWGKGRAAPLLPGQAATLAAELAAFLDEAQAEGLAIEPARLQGLVPEDHAEHWQLVLRFLDVLTEHWPAILEAEGCLDPAARRNALLMAQIERWRRRPPEHPVIAAGVTGALPAVAELLAAVAALPQGAVVLPGLDTAAAPELWDAIRDDPGHPQHTLGILVRRLEIDPADIRPWPTTDVPGGPAGRERLVREVLRPASTTHEWRDGTEAIGVEALDGIARLDCPGPLEEAVAIAILMRQCLEEPGRTAALVTPDRTLARRVAAELRRWGVEIDDSAGVPLNRAPPGAFLRLVLDAAAAELAPVPLLAALKHPFAAAGLTTAEFREAVRRFEKDVLRGPRPAPGVLGLREAVGEDGRHAPLLGRIAASLGPLLEAIGRPSVPLPELVRAHARAAEALAATPDAPGAALLWDQDAGEAAARFVAELVEAAHDFPPLRGTDYPALFEALLAGPVVRPRWGRHPRLSIWGLLEARLQSADLLILGGLNEGSWPPEAESDPWLSRPMRRDFGLAPPERRIGAAAHDFAQGIGARRVVLTRAARVEGAPTVPSRWLLRLDTVLKARGLELPREEPVRLLSWATQLDLPTTPRRPALPPAPRPPVRFRPRRLSVTQIETWMRDPYAIYARKILRLDRIEPLDADPGAADRGEIIHAALDRFVREHPGDLLPADALERLLRIGEREFGAALSRPGVWAFWWPRFERIARWFVERERERRRGIAASLTERRGRLELAGPAGAFELGATADRLDLLRDGGLVIIDYKTGGLPTGPEIKAGYAPQLPLEAAIARAGGFTGAAVEVAGLQHWRLSGGEPAGEVQELGADAAKLAELVDASVAGLLKLIEEFDREETPYLARPRPDKAPRYSDYVHLARVKEWLLATDVME